MLDYILTYSKINFYSVGQHSINCYREAKERGYSKRIQGLIYQKFGIGDLSKEEMDNIKDVDDALLYYEFKALMGEEIFDDKPYIVMEHDFEIEIIDSIEKVYLRYADNHPEVCFAILNSKGNFPEPIYENKKTQEGMSKRLELLSKYYYRRDDISEYILV